MTAHTYAALTVMEKTRLSYLFDSYYKHTATAAERQEFLDYVARAEHDEQLKMMLEENWLSIEEDTKPVRDPAAAQMLQNILGGETPVAPLSTRRSQHLLWRVMAAAMVLLLLGGATFYFRFKDQGVASIQHVAEASPGDADTTSKRAHKAILTLADGSEIILDHTQEGKLAEQGSAQVFRKEGAVLSYHANANTAEAVVHNTLTTPKGGTYQLLLPDGTKVWLNSYSSLNFPSQFSGSERKVTLTGEAYFEVAKNAKMPFKVAVAGMEVKVLGTHFNVMAYGDEKTINTSLLEGSVRVSSAGGNKLLKPGQESRMTKAGQLQVVEADLEEVMAWKNGWFNFNQADVPQLMRQLSRWYDLEVVYEGKVPEGRFSGLVKQANDVGQVLAILKAGGLKFKTQGKRITIMATSVK